jgi:hypothetical protein
VAVLGSIMASIYTTEVRPIVDAVPDTLMNQEQKSFARETVISVIEIVKTPTPSLFDGAKTNLIREMKEASLQGFQLASYVTVAASLLCAAAVAIFLPRFRSGGPSVLLVGKSDSVG